MCDLTEVIYSPNDVVWVKLGPVWWPGKVCASEEIPPEIIKDLRKTPIAIVKFFQEDSFEYVKSLSNIYHYHCPRKNEFIKKGLDMLRTKKSGAPSNMKLFPEDIVRAECLTNGNPAILQNSMFLPEEKPAYTDLFASKKTPKRVKPDVKKKPTPVKQETPRLITHPRFLQLSSGQSTDYEVRERKQMPVRAECDVEDTSPPTLYTCTDCDYTTTRLNVMVWHNKSHTRNYQSPQVSKPTKRKSTAYVKLKERSSGDSPGAQPLIDEVEAVSAAKIPKTNGTLNETRAPKTRGRKKGSTNAKKTPPQSTPLTKETNAASTTRTPAQKGRRGSANKADEIHKSLLEDWLEDDFEAEESAAIENSMVADATGENTVLTDSINSSNDSKSKSCFDFDDSEDHIVIDKSKFKPGRKIPRLLNKSASTLAPDDVVAIQDSTDAMDVDVTAADSMPKYQSGVEDSMDGESSLSRCQTSQLQEMGVDNEIEIKSEEMPPSEVVTESVPPKKSRRNLKTEAKANDAAELHDQVDKLLNEISKAPAKLPDIPRSHKKAQLKAYQQQAEAEEQAAQKAATEAEAAQKAVADVEAAQKAAANVEAAQQAIAEAEAAQKAVLKAVTEAAQKAAEIVESARKQSAGAKVAQNENIEAGTAQIATSVAAMAQVASTEAGIAPTVAEQEVVAENGDAGKTQATQQKVDEPVVYDLHPETIDIEVSSIPLPSPQKCPVTSELVESSISIGASVTVADNETLDEESSIVSPVKVSSEPLVTKTCGSSCIASDQKAAAAASSSVAEASGRSVTFDAKTLENLSVACKTTKQLNATRLMRVDPGTLRFLSPNNCRFVPNKLNPSASNLSPIKSPIEQFKAIKTTIKTADGKSILCDLAPSKMLFTNSQSSGSPTKLLVLRNFKKAGTTPATVTTAAETGAMTISTPVLAGATTLRLSPNILQKSAAAQKAAAALAKSTGKNIVLDASTFQSLFQTQPQQLLKLHSQIALPEAKATAKPQTPSSSAAGQTVDYNYIVDSSGNLVQVDEQPTTPTKAKDILAKALENTDGLQTEMALSAAATNSVLDACSVAQNTEMASKAEARCEKPPVNTAPIMSAYETPSRVVPSANVLAEANEVAAVSGNVDSDSQQLT